MVGIAQPRVLDALFRLLVEDLASLQVLAFVLQDKLTVSLGSSHVLSSSAGKCLEVPLPPTLAAVVGVPRCKVKVAFVLALSVDL